MGARTPQAHASPHVLRLSCGGRTTARGNSRATRNAAVRTIRLGAASADIEVMERTLSLTCPQCGQEFASALRMDTETFAKIKLESNIERCSNCGYSKRYHKDDYFFA